MKTAVFFVMLFGFGLPMQAGWIVKPEPAGIVYSARSDEGYASLDQALKELSDTGRIQKLKGLLAYALFSEDAFQEELFAGLERDAPDVWKAAQKSAGNMHNPKMGQLQEPFRKALLATPTIQKLNAALAAYGLTISSVGCEKFEFRSTQADSRRRFHGGLSFGIGKLPGS